VNLNNTPKTSQEALHSIYTLISKLASEEIKIAIING